MEINEILNYNSPEMRELFYKIEKTNANMVNYLEQNKPSLLVSNFWIIMKSVKCFMSRAGHFRIIGTKG